MDKHKAHVHVAGRTTEYIIPNVMGEGQHIMMTKKGPEDAAAGDVEMDDNATMGLGLDSLEEDDVVVEMDEVEDDGDLEVEDIGDLDIF